MSSVPASGAEPEHHEHEHHEHVRVVVRTPAGASHTFTVKLDELVVAAVATFVEYFVHAHELAPDDYSLAVVRDGTATPMVDTEELRAYGLVDGDVLHLVVTRPQVDG